MIASETRSQMRQKDILALAVVHSRYYNTPRKQEYTYGVGLKYDVWLAVSVSILVSETKTWLRIFSLFT